MKITLTERQEFALSERVAAGEFTSVEVAASTLLDERLFETDIEEHDIGHTRALLSEAEADIAAGAVLSYDEHRKQIDALLKSLG